KIVIGDQQYPVLVTDEQANGDFTFAADNADSPGVTVFVDTNRNGKFEPPERFRGSETIALDDAAVVVEKVSADGREIKLARASRSDPRTRAPVAPKLDAGSKALVFTAQALDGGTIRF